MARVTAVLEGYAAQAGAGVSVPVAHVLDLLSPRGMWRYDPEHRKGQQAAAEQAPAERTGLPDPLTGAKWPGPPGSSPPR